MANVIFVRLISGEELVGVDVSEANSLGLMGRVKLKNPAQIIVSPGRGPNQPPNIGFAPFIPYAEFSDDTPEFDRQHVVVMGKPVQQLENAYRQANKMPIGDVRPGLVTI